MKPRILQLVDSFNEGGSERQALQLARLLRESGRFDVYLATLDPSGVLRDEANSIVSEITSYPLNNFYDYNAGIQLRNLIKYLRARKIDLIHTHDFYTNIFGLTAGFLAGLSARVASRRETNCMRSRGQLAVQRLSYLFASRIVANSQAVRAKLIQEGIGEKRIAVIYNGIDMRRLATAGLTREESLRSLGLEKAEHRAFVTIVANMRHEVKDYPMFLRAARQVKQSAPGTGFLLAGEGPLRASLERVTSDLGLTEDVFFLGRCEQLADLLNVSDVCVLSSKAEGFSNSILEYMAAGRPVVATDVGGAREAIVEGETGYIVNSGDDTSMAKRIVSLLVFPEKARTMGERGKRRVAQQFSSQSLIENVEALYDSLLAEQPLTATPGHEMFLPEPSTQKRS